MQVTKAILLIGLVSPTYVQCQFTYEKGYLIDNYGHKKECLILNKDYKNNPKNFLQTQQKEEIPTFNLDYKWKFEPAGRTHVSHLQT